MDGSNYLLDPINLDSFNINDIVWTGSLSRVLEFTSEGSVVIQKE
jgi:hypothetical protein